MARLVTLKNRPNDRIGAGRTTTSASSVPPPMQHQATAPAPKKRGPAKKADKAAAAYGNSTFGYGSMANTLPSNTVAHTVTSKSKAPAAAAPMPQTMPVAVAPTAGPSHARRPRGSTSSVGAAAAK